MAVTSCEEVQGQDAYNISVESEKENVNPQYLACLNFQEDPQPNENRVCADHQWDSKNCTILQTGSVDRYSPCDVKIDVKKDLSETPSTCDRTIASLTRTESSLSRMPRGKISLQIGEKIMQLLMDDSNMLVKCTSGDKLAERVPDTPNSRWRRYKRAASFDSRKVEYWNSGFDIFDSASQTDR